MVLRLRFLREGFVVYISYLRRRRSRDFSLVLLPDAEAEEEDSHKPFVWYHLLFEVRRPKREKETKLPRTSRCVARSAICAAILMV